MDLLSTGLTKDTCCELMPELRGNRLNISELKGGITNKLYRVCSDSCDYAVRIYGDKTELFINRDHEAFAIKAMANINISPDLVKYMPENKVTIVNYITDSYTLNNKDFYKTSLHEHIMRPVRRIHNSKIKLPRIFNPLTEIQKMSTILNGLNVNYPKFKIAETIHRLETLFEIIGIPEEKYTACHNDLLAENFIMVKNRNGHFKEPMYIIDWEYAGMAPCYYDIADMFQEILVSRKIEKRLIKLYCKNHNFDKNLYYIDLFKPYPDIYWFLWSLIQLNVSTIEFNFYNYGKTKFENALNNLELINEKYSCGV